MDPVEWAKKEAYASWKSYKEQLAEQNAEAPSWDEARRAMWSDMTKAPYDAVENPEHYAQHPIQPIEFIMANKLGYCEGNIVKYVTRYNLKNGVEDLRKARNYLNILIEEHEKDGKV